MYCDLTLEGGIAGLRPGSRGSFGLAQDRPFVSAKGPKTISAQISHIESPWRNGGADQLARLRQGPPLGLSISPIGRSADRISSFSLVTVGFLPFDQKNTKILDSGLRE